MKKLLYILLLSPLFFVSSCEEDEVHGCLDAQACNYNAEATIDNNSCEYAADGFDCEGNITEYLVGMLAEGGIVFYVDESGEHGLVTAMEDLEVYYAWGCSGIGIDGADGTAIGTGYQNTLDIVSGCSETPIAASEALAYESEGYSDWYLPSKYELLEMYSTIGNGGPEGNIGGFDSGLYWSSSETGNNHAWPVDFNNGSTDANGKHGTTRVRAVRSF